MAIRCLLIATDGSDLAGHAVEQGVGLARAAGARVVFLTVVSPLHSLGALGDTFADQPAPIRKAALDYLLSDARRTLATASQVAEVAGVPAQTRHVESDHPHTAILEAAEAVGADLVVLATHGRTGIVKLVLGSVAQKVLTHADRPVLVCR